MVQVLTKVVGDQTGVIFETPIGHLYMEIKWILDFLRCDILCLLGLVGHKNYFQNI